MKLNISYSRERMEGKVFLQPSLNHTSRAAPLS